MRATKFGCFLNLLIEDVGIVRADLMQAAPGEPLVYWWS